MTSMVICEGRVRLFKRSDRPSRYWQAAFKVAGRRRPIVKSSRLAELAEAVAWATGQVEGAPASAPAPGMPRFLADDFSRTIRNAKRGVERLLTLRILEAFAGDPSISQRRLARKLNISIGVAHAYVDRCRAEGLVAAMAGEPRGKPDAPGLTARGEATVDKLIAWHLAENLAFFRELRRQLADIFHESRRRGAKRVVFVGAGDVAAIARLALSGSGLAPAGILVVHDGKVEGAAIARWAKDRACVFVVTDPVLPARSLAAIRRRVGDRRTAIPLALLGRSPQGAPEPSARDLASLLAQ